MHGIAGWVHEVGGALQIRYEVGGAPLRRSCVKLNLSAQEGIPLHHAALLRLLAPLGHVALQGRVDSQANCRAPQRDRPIYLATCLDVIPTHALGLGLGLALVPIFTFVLILALILVGRQGRLVIGAAPLRGHGAGDRSTHSSRAAVA